MNRRKFVQIGAATVASAAAGAVGGAAYQNRQGLANYWDWYHDAYLPWEERIAQRFDYLQLDRAGVQAFVRDYEKHIGELNALSPRDKDLFERFLMSTDFFQHGADESRPVRYVAFYDPYVTPCWNPCAKLA